MMTASMGMLSRLRERGGAFVSRRLQDKALALSARFPWRSSPVIEWKLEAMAEPEPGGERVRLRSHLCVKLRERKLDSWVEVTASSAALDEGSRALVPERLGRLGIEPKSGRPLQTWAGATGGQRAGFAMLTLMQLDKDRLPPSLRRALGEKPFHLTATLANVVEEN
jgi:hypothetical protein